MEVKDLDLENAVHYHYDQFPPQGLNFGVFVDGLIKATDAIARYDQMLKNMHNSEILVVPLRNQEAVISSRMEGTVSTMDEILKYEADHGGSYRKSECAIGSYRNHSLSESIKSNSSAASIVWTRSQKIF